MKHSLLKNILKLALFLLVIPGSLLAREESSDDISENAHYYYLEDPDNSFTIDSVRESNRFQEINESNANEGFTDSSYWIKIEFLSSHNNTPEKAAILVYEHSSMDNIEFYYPSSVNLDKYNVIITGDTFAYRTRQIAARPFAFYLNNSKSLKSTGPDVYYVKLRSVSGATPLLFKVQRAEDFWVGQRNHDMLYGVFFGVLAILSIYNFMIFLVLRDTSFLNYVFFLVSIVIYTLAIKSYGHQFIWSDYPWLNNYMMDIGSGISQLGMILFTYDFLQAKNNVYFRNAGKALLGSVVLFIILSLYDTNLTRELSIILPLGIIGYGVSLLVYARRKNTLAWKMYFWGMIALAIGVLIHLANIIGFSPMGLHYSYGSELGMMTMAVIFSLGLADRVRLINEEKNQVKTDLVEIRTELAAARRIQESILPDTRGYCQKRDEKIAICSKYMPMQDVGGDFFDIVRIDSQKWGILMADVEGHGMGAALLAVMVKNAFRFQADHLDDTSRVLKGMNDFIFSNIGDSFVTAIYTFIDLERMIVKVSRSGHHPMIVQSRETSFQEINPSGCPLGIYEIHNPECKEIPISYGDRLILYTDGVVESVNSQGVEFEYEFRRIIASSRNNDISQLVENVFDGLDAWNMNSSQNDDITFIAVDIRSLEEIAKLQ